jgi:23S rRNA (cytidine1920-2'-O)/16S rRNA (cytidine1409-2'-O)-methyltransferase
MKEKKRLDVIMAERGLAPSREKARALVMAGQVYSGTERLEKPGQSCDPEISIIVKGGGIPYVSRGGLKLAKAVEVFALSFQDMVVADLGASTGGFTDCALQNGAARVYAVDVGYGQLSWALRTDERVVCRERTNARYLRAGDLGEAVDWVVCDVSFISVTKLFGAMRAILKEEGQVLILIKPQFEAGRGAVGKRGVVRDPAVRARTITDVLTAAEAEGFAVWGLSYSPIRGPEGNVEFLAWLRMSGVSLDWRPSVTAVVGDAAFGVPQS